ncbi:hypothetical protein ACS0TY_015014 [Phlomoides rotata]
MSGIENSDYRSAKRKRNHPGMPATNRFVCEICNKGFHWDQNLQLHRRGHNISWKLPQRNSNEEVRKCVYVCPEISCEYHHPSRALGNLTGIKKHFCQKHGEKRYKCDRCPKMYAVESDVKAHMKTCGTTIIVVSVGLCFPEKIARMELLLIIFAMDELINMRDSFMSHKAYCDALAPESHHFDLLPPSSGICFSGKGFINTAGFFFF